MNVTMLLHIAQTKYHHQVLLHDTEIIILAWDTILDLHLTIIIGTDTGLTDQGHIPTVTGTEVTARAIPREATPGHITDVHTGAHLTKDTQTHIVINKIHHTGDLYHTEALPHILGIAVDQDHITHTELPVWHPPNPPTALAGLPGKTRIRNTNRSLLMTPIQLLQFWWTIQWVRWEFKLRESSLSNALHEWGGLPIAEIITVECIMDCTTITVHAGKYYKALIDSGAAISLLRYSTYKKLRIVTRHPYNLLQQN